MAKKVKSQIEAWAKKDRTEFDSVLSQVKRAPAEAYRPIAGRLTTIEDEEVAKEYATALFPSDSGSDKTRRSQTLRIWRGGADLYNRVVQAMIENPGKDSRGEPKRVLAAVMAAYTQLAKGASFDEAIEAGRQPGKTTTKVVPPEIRAAKALAKALKSKRSKKALALKAALEEFLEG